MSLVVWGFLGEGEGWGFFCLFCVCVHLLV
jgi:hypothetical protein